MNPPESMKSLLIFIRHAQQLEKHDPIMSYYCRYYAVQQGIKLRSAHPDEESKKFLINLMDQLEKQKLSIGAKLDEQGSGSTHVANFALRVFKMADDEDRSGKADKNTAKIQEKRKYAKWKAANITSALKKGLVPKPGAPNEENPEDEFLQVIPGAPSFSPEVPASFPDFDLTQTTSARSSDTTTFFPNVPVPTSKPAEQGNLSIPSFPDISGPSSLKNSKQYDASINSVQHSIPTPTLVTGGTSNYKPSEKDMEMANKYAKFVVSSLQFDDIPAAIKNLKLCLKTLTGSEAAI